MSFLRKVEDNAEIISNSVAMTTAAVGALLVAYSLSGGASSQVAGLGAVVVVVGGALSAFFLSEAEVTGRSLRGWHGTLGQCAGLVLLSAGALAQTLWLVHSAPPALKVVGAAFLVSGALLTRRHQVHDAAHTRWWRADKKKQEAARLREGEPILPMVPPPAAPASGELPPGVRPEVVERLLREAAATTRRHLESQGTTSPPRATKPAPIVALGVWLRGPGGR